MSYKIYISGKISGLADGNRAKFAAAKVALKDWYGNPVIEIINPHELCADISNKAWSSYMKKCLAKLVGVDEVVVLDDWKKSRGAIIEVLVADWLHIPVSRMEQPLTRIELKQSTKLRLFVKLLLKRF